LLLRPGAGIGRFESIEHDQYRPVLSPSQRQKKSPFIWEGVTLFLNQSIIAETLGRPAQLGRENTIVFDFVPPELIDDETDYKGNRALPEL
jgi:O-methyltransferase involved in polyketide biosynthesis